jgi:DNA-binding beta-propeller fold protein YncE
MRTAKTLLAIVAVLFAAQGFADEPTTAPATRPATTQPFVVLRHKMVGGPGRWDYITMDSEARRLYIPRTDRVTVYDADTLEQVGVIPATSGVHGVALNPDANVGFTSNGSDSSITMFDRKTLKPIQKIKVTGRPDGILYDPFTHRVFSFSHQAPNVTVISSDGSIVGTIDLGGAPEQAASDNKGNIYVNLESTSELVVLDAKELNITDRWKLGDGTDPTGLAFDAQNKRLFSCCGNEKMVILNAEDGTIIATLPIGKGVDAAVFDPQTMEAFSANRDSTLTVVKEFDPATFEVEQNVQTKFGARTCALDSKLHQIYLVTADFAAPTTQPAEEGGGRRRPQPIADTFTILVVGR